MKKILNLFLLFAALKLAASPYPIAAPWNGGYGTYIGWFAGDGSGLSNLNVAGSSYALYATNAGFAMLATNAVNATNIFGAGLVSMTNAALTVFTNSIALSNAYNGSFTGNGAGLTNVESTNILTDSRVLSPTSNATNYTVNLRPGEISNEQIVYLANTNAWITFTATNVADTVRGVFFNAFTDSVPSTVSLNLPGFHTNSTYSIWITNGFGGYFTFYNLDSTGTNLSAIDDGRIQ